MNLSLLPFQECQIYENSRIKVCHNILYRQREVIASVEKSLKISAGTQILVQQKVAGLA